MSSIVNIGLKRIKLNMQDAHVNFFVSITLFDERNDHNVKTGGPARLDPSPFKPTRLTLSHLILFKFKSD